MSHGACDFVGDSVGCDGDEWRVEAWFPEDCVAADCGEHGVPSPDGVWEVEGGDDADGAEREPLLIHAVAGPFAWEDAAWELPAQAYSEVADVDGFLDLADAFWEDFAHLE